MRMPAADSPPAATDWEDRWAGPDAELPGGGVLPVPAGHHPRVTHLVLVDGLPADHWFEDSTDGSWVSGRTGRRRRAERPLGEPDHEGQELRWLESLVGGAEALAALTDEPVDAAPPVLDVLPAPLRDRAVAISHRCDAAASAFSEPELGAVLRRVVEVVLTGDPGFLERSEHDDTAAGAFVWIGAQANGLVGPEGEVLARDLWTRLGLPASSAARGSTVLTRLRRRLPATTWLDASPPAGAPRFRATGHPELLTAATRSTIIARRDAVDRSG